MRRVGQSRRRDWNEHQIVSALRAVGIQIIRLSEVGCPDLLAYSKADGFRLIEVKGPRGHLTPEQTKFRALVPFTVVRNVEEALALYGVKH